MYVDNIGLLIKEINPRSPNFNNVWIVFGNNHNVNNDANYASYYVVRSATFLKIMNFWTKAKNEKLKKISNIPCLIDKKYVIDENQN